MSASAVFDIEQGLLHQCTVNMVVVPPSSEVETPTPRNAAASVSRTYRTGRLQFVMPLVLLYIADPVAVWGLVAGIVAAVAAVVGAVAAIYAAYYAKKAPTADDLERVEKNTADASERLEKVRVHIGSVDERSKEQHAQEKLAVVANRVSISARGTQLYGGPLRIAFTLKEPDVSLVYIELLNEVKALFGASLCTQEEPLVFTASIDGIAARRWFDGGKAEGNVDLRRLVIRATLRFEDREAHREFAVYLLNQLTDIASGGRSYVLQLNGDC